MSVQYVARRMENGDLHTQLGEAVAAGDVDHLYELVVSAPPHAATAALEAVSREHPQHVLLRFLAGVLHQDAGDHDAALQWFDAALERVVRHGDAEGVLVDLLEARSDALSASGTQPDELQQRGEVLLAQRLRQIAPADPLAQRSTQTAVALGWFPRGEWEAALRRWPELDTHGDYQAYAHAVQRQLLRRAQDGPSPSLSPIYVDAYLDWCEAREADAGDAATRAGYAAEVARLGNEVPWPPRRNEPCWCGSGAKYKQCCHRVGR